jgi:transposase-like protein
MSAQRPELMTVADVAKRFGVSESTVRVWLTHHDAGRTGGVPGLLPDPLARGVVWLTADIEAVAPAIEGRSVKGGRPKRAVDATEQHPEPSATEADPTA